MKACTFFGHADAPDIIKDTLREVIVNLITKENVTVFYVGVEGQYDRLCYRILKEIEFQYKYIKIFRVLAYLKNDNKFLEDSLYPLGIEKVPKRFAIPFRNKWMIRKSDYVISYVTRSVGGASKFADMAIKQNRIVINIAKLQC